MVVRDQRKTPTLAGEVGQGGDRKRNGKNLPLAGNPVPAPVSNPPPRKPRNQPKQASATGAVDPSLIMCMLEMLGIEPDVVQAVKKQIPSDSTCPGKEKRKLNCGSAGQNRMRVNARLKNLGSRCMPRILLIVEPRQGIVRRWTN